MQPILCGDSIFSRLFESYSYHFHPVSAEFCISGQTIGGLKKLVKERSSDLKGNKVIVMIGTNDFKRAGAGGGDEGVGKGGNVWADSEQHNGAASAATVLAGFPQDNMTSSGDDVNGRTAINMGHLYPHWQMIFNKYDEDADGRLSLAEMKRVVKSESFDHDIPNRCIKRLLAQADQNKDGYIEYEEFLKMVQEPEVRTMFGQGLHTYVRKTIVPRRPPPTVQRATDTTDYSVQHAMDAIDYGEYEDEYTCNPPAVCMIIVSLIEIIAFLYDVIETGRSTVSGPAARLFIYNPRERSQAWRYFSYMFVHVGVFHLAVNLMVQIMLGIPLEMVHRWWRVLLIYLAGVVAGSLGTSVSDPNVYLAGASGGVYAIMTAHIATIIMNFQEMQFAVYQLIVFLLLIVSDVGTAIYNRLHEVDDKVGYVAHLAGAIAGLLVGIQVLRNLEVRSWERVIWWASIILYLGLMTAAIVWNVAFPEYFPRPYECYGVGC